MPEIAIERTARRRILGDMRDEVRLSKYSHGAG